jgi:hypothetical protein
MATAPSRARAIQPFHREVGALAVALGNVVAALPAAIYTPPLTILRFKLFQPH